MSDATYKRRCSPEAAGNIERLSLGRRLSVAM